MVVWVFAGGGESEIRGLIPLLAGQYLAHRFVRKSPVRPKPGPRPESGRAQNRSRRARSGHGRTGKSLASQLSMFLSKSLKERENCDLILVLDDLDCHNPEDRREVFECAIHSVEDAAHLQSYICFASPEIEAWIVADWGNSIAKDGDFRQCHQRMRHWLSTEKSVPFDRPEEFSSLDPERGSCRDKLSDVLVESSIQCSARARYSKGTHTPRFLRQISPEVVSRKCPHFRALHNRLSQKE